MPTTASATVSARQLTSGETAFRHQVERHREDRRNDVLVACPDARSPAYQAVIGLARAGQLGRFVSGYYYRGDGLLAATPWLGRWDRLLRRRHDPEIPARRVVSDWGFDLALAAERRVAKTQPAARLQLARWRTRRFDKLVTRTLARDQPGAAILFSDVASEFGLPECRRLGIPTVLSMVHGDVREERDVMEIEANASPDFFSIYLGNGKVDPDEMNWLHERRLRDIELADIILVPSEHIASELARHGTSRDRIAVIPYAADTSRFVPDCSKVHSEACTFLFAGGITQRKGIKYLLEAWRRVRRPGWRLQLLGALPADSTPLLPYLDEVELLGRCSHAEVSSRMARADVFVFPSLFEGSAVVTYEAMACGLPCIVTAEAGSVARHEREGLIVPTRDIEALAAAFERIGTDVPFRAACAVSARAQAEAHDWPRYHDAVLEAVRRVTDRHDHHSAEPHRGIQ